MTKFSQADAVASFPRRHAKTRRFSLGAPRSFSVSKGGDSVLFVQSDGPEDPVNSLRILRRGEDPVVLFDPAGGRDGELTDAERARRERAREQAGGVVSFAARSDHSEVVFAIGGQLNRVAATGDHQIMKSSGNVFDPRLEPGGERVVYVDGRTLRISTGNDDRGIVGTSEEPNTISWGSAEFVAAEEMGRGRGYWWSPSGQRVAACRVDTAGVEEWWISSPDRPERPPRPIRYPAAGTANADVQLWIVDVDEGPLRQVDWARGEFEYLAVVEWLTVDDSEVIRCVTQTRDQRTLVIADFDPESGERTEIQRITDDHWVELHRGTPRHSDHGMIMVVDDELRTLTVDGAPIPGLSQNIRSFVGVSGDQLIATLTTDGTDSVVARIGLDGAVEQLTEPEQFSSAVTSGDTMVVTTASRNSDPTGSTSEVRWSDGSVTPLVSHADGPRFNGLPNFWVAGDRSLNVGICLPFDHDGSPLPVLLDPYGGPHAQRVLRSRNAFATSQWFAEQGFAVVVVDGRGTPGRGPAFEREIYGDLATKILDDQIDALHSIADGNPVFDLDRVGIRGWSFGGYLAALAVMRRPDAVHAAIAGAPVTEWRLYDTHYTERYLGHPDEVPEHYDQSSLLLDAGALSRPLMLIHGLADDNVVAAHTLQFSQALLEAGRPHEVLPLSGVTHMTPQEQVAENLLHLQRDFLHKHLT